MNARGRNRSGCPIDYSLDIFGDRWTLLVIRDLVFAGKQRFNEMIASPEGIASNILAARLKKLEADGLISRRPDPGNRRQVLYGLTEKGIDLLPVLVEIILWGSKHDPNTASPKHIIRRMRADRDGFIAELTAAVRARANDARRNRNDQTRGT